MRVKIYDCYCALCCGPMAGPITVGDGSADAVQLRRARIAEEVARRQQEPNASSVSQKQSYEHLHRLPNRPDIRVLSYEQPRSSRCDECSYDPEVLDFAAVQDFLNDRKCLCYDPSSHSELGKQTVWRPVLTYRSRSHVSACNTY